MVVKMKVKDLQPWVDYFRLLRTYEKKGFLQTEPDKHEAYIAVSAFGALANADGYDSQFKLNRAYSALSLRIRAYSAWKSQEGMVYMDSPFAIHIVKGEYPHDPMFTVLVSRKRKWWSLGFKVDSIEVIRYED